MTPIDPRAKVARLRSLLAKYRGGRFEVFASGGSDGMVLFIDAQDRQWFSGRVNSEHSRAIAYAVTASIRLLYDSGVDRRLTSANLRRSLAMYRGCRFITGDEDSAGGMVSILDLRGEKKFIGGFNGGHAHSLVEALNLTLELLAAPSSREVTSGDETSRPALPSASSRRT